MSFSLLKRILPVAKKVINTSNRIQTTRYFFNMKTLNERMKYTENDEWILALDETTHKVGLSNFASESLGELVYIEYNFEPGDFFNEGDEIVSVESVKASNGILAPFDGKLIENNLSIEENPQLVTDNPEDDSVSWFCKIDKPTEFNM